MVVTWVSVFSTENLNRLRLPYKKQKKTKNRSNLQLAFEFFCVFNKFTCPHFELPASHVGFEMCVHE